MNWCTERLVRRNSCVKSYIWQTLVGQGTLLKLGGIKDSGASYSKSNEIHTNDRIQAGFKRFYTKLKYLAGYISFTNGIIDIIKKFQSIFKITRY